MFVDSTVSSIDRLYVVLDPPNNLAIRDHPFVFGLA